MKYSSQSHKKRVKNDDMTVIDAKTKTCNALENFVTNFN